MFCPLAALIYICLMGILLISMSWLKGHNYTVAQQCTYYQFCKRPRKSMHTEKCMDKNIFLTR